MIRHDIYPARGRKQIDWYNIVCHLSRFATIFTPQGDGNAKVASAFGKKYNYSPRYLPRKGTETTRMVFPNPIGDRFATIFTPQGDGNLCKPSLDRLLTFNSPRYLPRKGTETAIASIIRGLGDGIRHDIYPARGRKPIMSIGVRSHINGIRHDIYPARGRKLE